MAGVRGVRKSMTLSSTAADLQFAMDRCERKMISMHFIQAERQPVMEVQANVEGMVVTQIEHGIIHLVFSDGAGAGAGVLMRVAGALRKATK